MRSRPIKPRLQSFTKMGSFAQVLDLVLSSASSQAGRNGTCDPTASKRTHFKSHLLHRRQGPAQPCRHRPAVILALYRKSLATVIKAEHFVVQVEHRKNGLQPMPAWNPVAYLSVHLSVWIEVRIAAWAFVRRPGVRPNVAVIVGQAHSRREGLLVVGHIEVPVVRRRAHQRRMVGALARNAREGGLGSGVAVVRPYPYSVQRTWQERQKLLP